MAHAPAPVTREDCERLRAELVRLDALGAAQAKPRRLVEHLFGSDRRLRHVMTEAPGLGVPLASCGEGYYVVTRPEDADACVADLRSRMVELARRATALEGIRRDLAVGDGRLF